MPIEIDTIDDRTVCRFSGALTIWEAANLWQQFNPLLGSSEPLVIDLAEVKECDAAGVQILCQLRRAMGQPNREIRVQAMPQPVQAALQVAGFDARSSFNLPEEV